MADEWFKSIGSDDERPPVGIDASVPHIARIYDYWLGGKDNFAVDREAAKRVIEATPAVLPGVRANRRFLGRTVRYLAERHGIRQFLDIGTGIPTANNTHEVAQAVASDSHVVYVDNDPIVLTHARALLTSVTGTTAYLDKDLRDTEAILAEAAATLDFSKPVAVLLIAVLHCVPDDDDPAGIVRTLREAVIPGSFLAISHPAIDQVPEHSAAAEASLTKALGMKVTFRSRDQVTAFFDGLELVEPGVVPVQEWRPGPGQEPPVPTAMWGGLARKPL